MAPTTVQTTGRGIVAMVMATLLLLPFTDTARRPVLDIGANHIPPRTPTRHRTPRMGPGLATIRVTAIAPTTEITLRTHGATDPASMMRPGRIPTSARTTVAAITIGIGTAISRVPRGRHQGRAPGSTTSRTKRWRTRMRRQITRGGTHRAGSFPSRQRRHARRGWLHAAAVRAKSCYTVGAIGMSPCRFSTSSSTTRS